MKTKEAQWIAQNTGPKFHLGPEVVPTTEDYRRHRKEMRWLKFWAVLVLVVVGFLIYSGNTMTAGEIALLDKRGAALSSGTGDYDCAGGSGNGPNYVNGPIQVGPSDPYGLDADGDDIGCEG